MSDHEEREVITLPIPIPDFDVGFADGDLEMPMLSATQVVEMITHVAGHMNEVDPGQAMNFYGMANLLIRIVDDAIAQARQEGFDE